MAVAARIVPGLASGLDFVQWGPGGKSLYVRDNNNLPTTVFQVDVSTGQKRTVRQLMPADPSGIRTVWAVAMSPDGKSYAYNYFRQLSQLLVVEGLKYNSARSLTPKNYESELRPQKPLSSIVFRPFRKARITLRNGRPLKMLWQASTFSRGTILDFLTGKRSKESRGNVVTVRGSIFFPMDVFL